VPAGDPTEDTIVALADLLGPGDLVIDGGNANWTDSVRRGERLAEREIGFIDAGVSGGVWGRENGYALMVGGRDEHVAVAQPLFDVLKPPDGGFAHVGGVGTGHFTKMVHNGIEYGLMQAYAEGYAILSKSGLGIDAQAAVEAWRHGSVVRSWLLDLLCQAVNDADFAHIRAVAADSGEGRWTVNEAVRLGVAAPVISAALFARFNSQDDDGVTMRVIAALRNQFGGHAVEMFE
jgi:6-phosphogluconate dehydrogenase